MTHFKEIKSKSFRTLLLSQQRGILLFVQLFFIALSILKLQAQIQTTQTFTSNATFTVPTGVSSIDVVARSVNGSSDGCTISATIAVSPNDVLFIKVGGYRDSNFGGGTADIRTGSALSTRILVAGGSGSSYAAPHVCSNIVQMQGNDAGAASIEIRFFTQFYCIMSCDGENTTVSSTSVPKLYWSENPSQTMALYYNDNRWQIDNDEIEPDYIYTYQTTSSSPVGTYYYTQGGSGTYFYPISIAVSEGVCPVSVISYVKETTKHLEPITLSVSATTSPICVGINLTITANSLGTGSNITAAKNANDTANIATTDFEAYPNPTDGLLHVVIHHETVSHSQLQLYNHLGQMVLAKEIHFFAGKANTELDLRQLAANVYSLSFENRVIKVVKE